jgi:hypothetical protein
MGDIKRGYRSRMDAKAEPSAGAGRDQPPRKPN